MKPNTGSNNVAISRKHLGYLLSIFGDIAASDAVVASPLEFNHIVDTCARVIINLLLINLLTAEAKKKSLGLMTYF